MNKLILSLACVCLSLKSFGQIDFKANQLSDVTICTGETVTLDATATAFCDNTISGSQNITIDTDESYCVAEGSTLSGNITINGGYLIVSGDMQVSQMTLNGGYLIITNTATISQLNFNSSSATIQNYGHLQLGYTTVNGHIDNYGEMISVTLANYDTIINSGSIIVQGDLNNNGLLDNKGHIIVSGTSYQNSGSLRLLDGMLLETQHLTVNGSIVGGQSSCAKLSVSGTTLIPNAQHLSGYLDLCDANGIESVVGTLSSTISQDCQCATFAPNIIDGSSLSYQWLPTTGLSDPNSSTPVASPTQTTTYTVIISDPFGNVIQDEMTVYVTSLAGENKTICMGDSVALSVNTACVALPTSHAGSNCVPVVPNEDCSTCTNPISGNGFVSVNNGEVKCIPEGSMFSGNLNIDGGKLIVCGILDPSHINFNGGELVVLGQASFDQLTVSGILRNFGTVSIQNQLNVNTAGVLENNGSLQSQHAIFSGTTNNNAQLYITGDASNNGSFTNHCTFEVGQQLQINNNLINSGKITAGYQTSLNNGLLTMNEGASLETQRWISNGNIQGGTTQCASILVSDYTAINSGTFSGHLDLCDANGIELNFGNLSADVMTDCSCSPTTVSPSEISYLWTPAEGLSDPTSANPIAVPTTSTSYTVQLFANGIEIASDQVNVVVETICTQLLEHEFIISFDHHNVNTLAIDDVNFQSGMASDFLKPNFITYLNNELGFDVGSCQTRKVFKILTSDQQYTIDRLGNQVKIPEHLWSTFVVTIPETHDPYLCLQEVNKLESGINYAEFNAITGHYNSAPNDQFYTLQRFMFFDPLNPDATIYLEDAWDISTGDSRIKVGVYDSGIRQTHEEFQNPFTGQSIIMGGYNYVDDTPLTTAPPAHFHGTRVSGLIGALRNNASATSFNSGWIAGVAGGDVDGAGHVGVSLYDFQIGNNITFAPIDVQANAILEGAADLGTLPSHLNGYGLHIQNFSLGYSNDFQVIRDAIAFSHTNQCIVVAARGNEDNSNLQDVPFYPAAYADELVINVGASNQDGERASFSMIGHGLDFVAPGTSDIVATLDNDHDQDFITVKGTSYSAPIVSGVIGLLKSHYDYVPGNTPLAIEDVEAILQKTTEDILPTGYDDTTGWGKINALSALQAIEQPYYKIRHYTGNITSSNLVNTTTIELKQEVNGAQAGIYLAQHYEVNSVIEIDDLVSGEIILDLWETHSMTNLWDIDGHNNYLNRTKIINVTGNQVTLQSYFWVLRAIYMGPVEGYVNIPAYQIPVDPGAEKMSVSVYTYNPTPLITATSIPETNQETMIYPNPNDGSFQVSILQPDVTQVDITIHNLLGQQVYATETQLNTSSSMITVETSLPSGVYLLTTEMENSTSTLKFIVQ